MGNYGKTDGPIDPDEDVIIIHVGHLSDERYNAVVKSIVEFMNARWPNVNMMGIDS